MHKGMTRMEIAEIEMLWNDCLTLRRLSVETSPLANQPARD